MNSGRNTSRRPSRLTVETLESRDLMAAFGVPWGDARQLTLSFVPDGTPIAGHVSTLSATLNRQMPAATWQSEILRAFQTWGATANINIGLTPDDGSPLGTPGNTQHDPRFGDIRIGAQSMSLDALSVSVPYDFSLSGTLSGDVLLNSDISFDGKAADLFAVALHEAGHVLGLDHSTDPKSPMFSNLSFATKPTAVDIAALQALYGVRGPDAFEGSSGNGSISKATTISQPGSYRGATPLVVFGDITNTADVDVFATKTPSGYRGPVTFRLQTAGLSLLTPRITVLDSRGAVLGMAQSAQKVGDTLSITLPTSDPNATYVLRVEGATKDEFGVGSYGLAVSFNSTQTVPTSALDRFLRTAPASLDQDEVAASFTSASTLLINDDHHADDAELSATVLSTLPGYSQGSRYETIGSLSDASDVDYYRIDAANTRGKAPLVLTVTVRSLGAAGATPRVSVLDRDGLPVAAQVIANGNGTFTIQSVGIKAGAHYFVKVQDGGTSQPSGNYELDVVFGTTPAALSTFATGTIAAATSQTFNLYIAQSQLFQFLLKSMPGGISALGTSVRMSVINARGVEVYSLTAGAGLPVSGRALFITPGAYTVRFTTLSSTGGTGPAMAYVLFGESLSDPVGPSLSDPTLAPVYTVPNRPPGTVPLYTYPGSITTTKPYLLTLLK